MIVQPCEYDPVQVIMCMWKSDVNFWFLSPTLLRPSLSYCICQAVYSRLAFPWACPWFSCLCSSISLQQCYDYRCMPPCLAFCVTSGHGIQVAMLFGKQFYPLNHIRSLDIKLVFFFLFVFLPSCSDVLSSRIIDYTPMPGCQANTLPIELHSLPKYYSFKCFQLIWMFQEVCRPNEICLGPHFTPRSLVDKFNLIILDYWIVCLVISLPLFFELTCL